MSPSITFTGVDNAIENLNYKNKRAHKYKFVEAIRNFYSDDIHFDSVTEIERDKLISVIWETDDPAEIKSKRINFNSIKAAVNSDLKKLYKKGMNSEGLTISAQNTFEMSAEAKDQLLESFVNSIKADGKLDYHKVSLVLNMVTSFLENLESKVDNQKSDEVIRQIQSILNTLSTKVVDADPEQPELPEGKKLVIEPDENPEDDFEYVQEEGEEDDFDFGDSQDESEDEDELDFLEEDTDEDEFEIDEDEFDDIDDIVDEEFEYLDEDEEDEEFEEDPEDEEYEEIEIDEDEIEDGDEIIRDVEDEDFDYLDDDDDFEIEEDPYEDDYDEIEIQEEDELDYLDEDDDEEIEDEDYEDIEYEDDEDIEFIDEEEEDEEFEDEDEDEFEEIEIDEDDDFEIIDEDEDIEFVDEDDDFEELDAEDFEEIELDEDEDIEFEDLEEDIEFEDVEEDDFSEIIDDDEYDIEEVEEDEDVEEIEGDDFEFVDEEEEDVDFEELDEDEFDEFDEDLFDDDYDYEELDEEEDDVDFIDEEDDFDLIEKDDEYDDLELDQDELEDFDILDESDYSDASDRNRIRAEKFDEFLGSIEKQYNIYEHIPAGRYKIGTEHPKGNELIEQRVTLSDFYMGKFPITNSLFEIFIQRTGYLTTAEKKGFGKVYEGRFKKIVDPHTGKTKSQWNSTFRSKDVKGAAWFQPEGPGSSLHNKRFHPVVQVSYYDCISFAKWVGKRLPTEFEWEGAARTKRGLIYPWGDKFDIKKCNIETTEVSDTTSVDKFENGINRYELFDLIGNVMEWTRDETDPPYKRESKDKFYIVKGGSFISGKNITLYSRSMFKDDFCSNILGFRCVLK